MKKSKRTNQLHNEQNRAALGMVGNDDDFSEASQAQDIIHTNVTQDTTATHVPQDTTPTSTGPPAPPGFPIPVNPSDQSPVASEPQEPDNIRLMQPLCSQFEPMNSGQAALVGGIRAMLDEWGKRLTPDILMQNVRDFFPPTRLFHPNILETPEYYAKLRKIMEIYDVPVPDLPEDRKTNTFRVARALYLEPGWKTDLDTSLNLIEIHRSPPHRNSKANTITHSNLLISRRRQTPINLTQKVPSFSDIRTNNPNMAAESQNLGKSVLANTTPSAPRFV